MKTMSAEDFDRLKSDQPCPIISEQRSRLAFRLAITISICWSHLSFSEVQLDDDEPLTEEPVLISCQPEQSGIALQRPGKAAIQYDTSDRCERKLVEPGTRVEATTVLLELSNPDVQLELLEAQRLEQRTTYDLDGLAALTLQVYERGLDSLQPIVA